MVWEHNDDLSGVQNEWAFKSRTFTAQIKGVVPETGTMTIELIGSRERYVVDIPVTGFSIKGQQSAWQRYMPTEREYVDITFDARNRPRVVGISLFSDNDSGAYAAVAAAKGVANKNLDLIFRRLARGEFDLRSSGGAGYYFSKDGHATLQAGTTTIELDKNRSESVGKAGLWVRGGDGAEVRHGDVKRLLPGTFDETSVGLIPPQLTPNPTAVAPKEYRRELGKLVPGPIPLLLETLEVGDVRAGATDLFIPALGPYGIPLRYRHKLFDATGLIPTLTVVVDALGNVKVTQDKLAVPGGIELVGGELSPLKTSFFSQSHAAATSIALSATTTLDLSSGAGPGFMNLNAGGAADVFLVRGDDLKLWLDTTLKIWADTHVHPTSAPGSPTGPAAVPLTAAPPTILSMTAKVK